MSRRFQTLCAVLPTALALALTAPSVTLAAGSEEPEMAGAGDAGNAARELYDQGLEEVEAGQFAAARDLFRKSLRRAPNDPDALNMLAYSQRKTGNLDTAIKTYQLALRARPEFPQAREYLGEAYLEAALRELAALREAGAEGRSSREMLEAALRDAAARLDAEPAAARAPSSSEW